MYLKRTVFWEYNTGATAVVTVHGSRYVISHDKGYALLQYYFPKYGDRGSTVAKVLCYKSEGRRFDPSWCHWNFSLA